MSLKLAHTTDAMLLIKYDMISVLRPGQVSCEFIFNTIYSVFSPGVEKTRSCNMCISFALKITRK